MPWERVFYFDGEQWFPVMSMNNAKGDTTELPELAVVVVVRYTEDSWATYLLGEKSVLGYYPVH